jgi:ubiquinone biosynthesis protein
VPKLLRRDQSLRRTVTSVQAQAAVGAARLRTLPGRLDALLSGVENGTFSLKLKAFSDDAGQGFVQSIASELVGTLISIAAVVIALVLVVTDSGPLLTEGLRLFDLFGAFIGFLGFLGLLRVVRQIIVRRRR